MRTHDVLTQGILLSLLFFFSFWFLRLPSFFSFTSLFGFICVCMCVCVCVIHLLYFLISFRLALAASLALYFISFFFLFCSVITSTLLVCLTEFVALVFVVVVFFVLRHVNHNRYPSHTLSINCSPSSNSIRTHYNIHKLIYTPSTTKKKKKRSNAVTCHSTRASPSAAQHSP